MQPSRRRAEGLDTFESEGTAQTPPPASKPETEDDDAASEDNAATPRPTEYVPRSLRMTHPTEVKIHETKFKILD